MRITLLAKPYLFVFVSFPNSPGDPVETNRLAIRIVSNLLGSTLLNIPILFNAN